MKILIVEDETAAYENLVDILAEIDIGIQITGFTESISQTVHWLQNNPAPELILMDIHLSDGSAFSIFKAIQVETPIIFTTAYDEYAIDAFKVNSIDYLLKPIKVDELRNALEKFNKLKQPEILQYLSQLNRLAATGKFRDKLLIPYKDQLLPIDLDSVSCFYTTEKNTRIYLKDGKFFPFCKTLDQIAATLDPTNFIRANKQYIIARQSVKNITIWFDSRLLITLDIEVPERIYVSKNKAAEFKAWITSER
jgi:two-component system, LytTR family, response regulator LytT